MQDLSVRDLLHTFVLFILNSPMTKKFYTVRADQKLLHLNFLEHFIFKVFHSANFFLVFCCSLTWLCSGHHVIKMVFLLVPVYFIQVWSYMILLLSFSGAQTHMTVKK